MAKVSPEKLNIHFNPYNVDTTAKPGSNLMEAAVAAGVHINASCGGTGVCGTCKVLIRKGEVESTRTKWISTKEYESGIRQACQSQIISDLIVDILPESRMEKGVLLREKKQMAAGAAMSLADGWSFDPPVKKLLVTLPQPTLEDNISDLSRLLKGLKQQYSLDNVLLDTDLLPKLAGVLRDGGWQVTVTTLLENDSYLRIVNIEPGDARARHYSLAFDIGTTAIRGQLLDLNRGKALAQSIEYNRQISYGEDVISRIVQSQKAGGLKKLQWAVVATLNDMIKIMTAEAGIKTVDICHLVVAANSVMVQLLLGLDPKYLRLSPYVPTVNNIPLVRANILGIELGEHAYLYTMPLVASYVGGDIVAGVLGTGLYQRETVTLYIDIGTNGEMVIGNSDWMVTAACSAGPTFEGGGIKHGMIAAAGAIEGFDINPMNYEPIIDVIGGERPKGICGSGLINIVATLLKAGIITQNGKFNTALQSKRVRKGNDGYEYVLAWAPETQIDKDIIITEVDIDNLIRSKAAMYAGCQTLVKSIGASCSDMEHVIIAGTFGCNINIENAVTIGLLPDLPRERFIFIGNGSLLGARLTSYSKDMLRDGRRIATMMTNIELSENADFMDNYIAALFLPHTHAEVFPSVTIEKGRAN
ncbi:MAG TPA: DUF4445 domain-containing protein [Dehalococcoidia bacterium]|nr:DUF4445 domain-containing protein [Dehalococcoidia bacterium]